MVRACSTNGGEEECVLVIGGKARRKETARKTKTEVNLVIILGFQKIPTIVSQIDASSC
jgi:hypothetical protein